MADRIIHHLQWQYLSKYPIEQQAEVWQAIAEAAHQYTTADGVLQMENEVILVAGQRER